MGLKVKINTKKPATTENGWYVAKWKSKDYNRILCVRNSISIIVFANDMSTAQVYNMKSALHLYKEWQPAKVTMEAN